MTQFGEFLYPRIQSGKGEANWDQGMIICHTCLFRRLGQYGASTFIHSDPKERAKSFIDFLSQG
jgi:hypothetical protein